MPRFRSPLDFVTPGLPAFKFPHSLLETAVLQSAISTIASFTSTTLMSYDAATRRFIVLNPANNIAGTAYMTQSGHRWVLLGNYNLGAAYPLEPSCIASDGVNTVLLGGWTDALNMKIRRTVDGGGGWQFVTIGASNSDEVCGLGYSSALSLWFASTTTQGTFTSVDGSDASWSVISAPATYMGNVYARNNGSPLVMLSASSGPPGTGYYTTTNGTSLTTRTFPATMAYTRGCYSEYWKLFYAHSAANTYTSPDAVNWTMLNDTPANLYAHGHLLLRSDGYLSSDGGTTWASCIETLSSADWIGSTYGRTLLRDGDTFFVSAGTKV